MVDNNEKTTGGITGKGFQPGQSGNPGGRPAMAREFKQRCRDFADEEGIDALIAIAKDAKDRDRFRALELIMAYSWGKPKQGVELSGEDGNNIRIIVEGV